MLLAAVAGFGLAALLVVAAKWLWPQSSELRPAPYVVLPDMTDEELVAHPFLALRLYHVMAVLDDGAQFASAIVLSRPFITPEAAEAERLQQLATYPNARVVPVVLGFDPENGRAVEAFCKIANEGLL